MLFPGWVFVVSVYFLVAPHERAGRTADAA